jgi:hypothetical protein
MTTMTKETTTGWGHKGAPARARLVVALVVSGLLLHARPLLAQETITDVLSFLLTNQSVPTGDFVKDVEAGQVTRDTMTRLLLVELATLPISSSSGGFSYRLNPDLGTLERTSDSFGPFFAERSLTAGRGQASFGVNVRVASFTAIDGRDLQSGDFITAANQFRDEAQPFDVEMLTLDLESRTLTFYGNVGITDRLDVSVAAPMVSLTLDGVRNNTYRGTTLLQARANASVTGFGDMALRAKLRLAGGTGSGLAVLQEVRLPTGRADDLLGAGKAAWRTLIIGSVEPGRVAWHFNGGFTAGGLANELNYRTAVSFSATPQVTLVGELLGRRLDDIGRVISARLPHPEFVDVDTIRLVTERGSTYGSYAVGGIKWNIGGTWILGGHVSFPLTDRGLKSGIVTVIGVDYAIGG